MQKGCCRMGCTPLRLPMATRKHQSRYEHQMGRRMGLLQAWLCHAWASARLTFYVMR